MAKTNAEHQAGWRQRHGERVARLEAENERLARLVLGLEAALERAGADIARLSGDQCQHPSGSVSDGQCAACGEWL
jgi:hypothetical protein